MAANNDNISLTGVWHGLYTYPERSRMPESHFTATIIDSGGNLSGTIHEAMNHRNRPATEANASLDGWIEGSQVSFIKTYDGTSGHNHSLAYQGVLSGDRDEIEGTWTVTKNGFSGRFLMIRKRGQGAAAKVEAFEKA